jgi:hypothetical protein
MAKLQFHILFREFLFRMVDLELLAAQGDITRLLGQFAALLLVISSGLALGGLFFGPGRMKPQALMIFLWNMEHFLIATTMLVVGLFAVLSWDSAFPDRRDVLILSPLPVRPRTMFFAKVTALAASLSLTVVSLNSLSGLIWPIHFIAPGAGFLGFFRSLAAYWITMLSAGAFIFCSVLGLQGLAAQLPRRRFLRVSAILQMSAFGLFVGVYFLQPSLATPAALAAPENQRALAWLPTYWFLGLFQSLNGSSHPAMAPLARRAALSLLIAIGSSGVAFLLAYFRTLRKIVEEPDILPGARARSWPLRFGNPFKTAVVLFSIRTLFRSRQHRVILAFYLGVAFAMIMMLVIPAAPERHRLGQLNVPYLVASTLTLCFWIAGTRVVFSLPLDLRANWIFRIAPLRPGAPCQSAVRRAILVLALVPFWLASAAAFFAFWPWRPALVHVAVLGLFGLILSDAALYGFQKLPFTCSYLPGKSQLHMVIVSGLGILLVLQAIEEAELNALKSPAASIGMLLVLTAAAVLVRWGVSARAKSSHAVLQFEEEMPPVILSLGVGQPLRSSTAAPLAPTPAK